MILTARNLRMIFQALYGYRWAEEAAEHLCVTLKTIRRWTRPGGQAPACRQKKIETAVAEKIADLEDIRTRIMRI